MIGHDLFWKVQNTNVCVFSTCAAIFVNLLLVCLLGIQPET